jgi:two-component system, cell cycle sensor histidine kinase and response regulator CckA
MRGPLRLLLVEDSQEDELLLLHLLRRSGYQIVHERVDTAPAMEAALDRSEWDLVLSDNFMPHFSAPAALTVLKQRGLDLPFIIFSGTITDELAVAAMKAGASDYVMKSNQARLLPAIERALREAALRREHQQVAEQLRRSQKLEAFGQLAGGIAHDVNNMLAVISGYSSLLQDRLTLEDPLRRYVQEIGKAGERTAALTRQLLAFSRKQVLTPRALDLNQVVLDMDAMLRPLIGADIELVTLPYPARASVLADPSQLEQVILNLAVNARDAMPRGGTLTLETQHVELDAAAARHVDTPAGSYVLLTVSDTGCGMDAETRARLFDPFFTKGKEHGTGLGLATVYGIVRQSGGQIAVESSPGQGACFRIYLPRVEAEGEGVPVGEVPGGPNAGWETVLVVEDEPLVRELIREVLTGQGYTVLEASHGAQAVEVCEQHPGPIHLVITDVVLPRMSGRELTERITAQRPEAKVLFMSGYADDAVLRHGILAGEAAFLPKPFTPATLAEKVRERLG